MSSNEYLKVKHTLRMLLRSFASTTAVDIVTLMERQEAFDRKSQEWLGLCYRVNDLYGGYTEVIETIYPCNEREMGDWVQLLDEKVGAILLEKYRVEK